MANQIHRETKEVCMIESNCGVGEQRGEAVSDSGEAANSMHPGIVDSRRRSMPGAEETGSWTRTWAAISGRH